MFIGLSLKEVTGYLWKSILSGTMSWELHWVSGIQSWRWEKVHSMDTFIWQLCQEMKEIDKTRINLEIVWLTRASFCFSYLNVYFSLTSQLAPLFSTY